MSIHTFIIRFYSDGEVINRCEWGRTRLQALKTLWGIYGRDTFEVIG